MEILLYIALVYVFYKLMGGSESFDEAKQREAERIERNSNNP